MKKSQEFKSCQICGYLADDEYEGICPACGASEKAFKNYVQRITTRRIRILNLDIHPILTHFSVGLTFLLFVIYLLSLGFSEILKITLSYGGVLDFLVYVTPIFILLTAITGIIDGKLRLRKLNTPYLKLKIIFGSSAIVSSILILTFHLLSQNGSKIISLILEGILMLLLMGMIGFLGFIGSKLICTIVPQGKIKEKQ